ncbi:MAG TPA: type II secretion system F family protein [Gaiellaceae bacterium]|nr:type II secretion system F family protein [Gaiellaceae bacterium]
MLLILAFLCVGGAVLFAAELMTEQSRQRSASLRRIRAYGSSPGATDRRATSTLGRRYETGLAGLALRLDPRQTTERVGLRLVSAGLAERWTPTRFLATKVVLAGAGVVLGGLLTASTGRFGWAIVGAAAAGALGFLLPDIRVRTRIDKRREQIRREMPDALDVLAVSVEAGLGFDQALSRLREQMSGPLVEEFQLVLSEIRVGESRSNALRKMAERVDVAELHGFVHSMIQADQLGTPLAKILRVQAQESRRRRQVAAEERAMKAPVKMLVPIAIFIFPAMFVVILGPAVIKILDVL